MARVSWPRAIVVVGSLGLLSPGSAVLVACQPDPAPAFDVASAYVPLALEGDCAAADGYVEFDDEVDTLEAVVSWDGAEEPKEASGSLSEPLTLTEVPIGQDRRVALFGLNANGFKTWRSVRFGVEVLRDAETTVEMLMSRIADLSCPRNLMHNPRAFHTATRLADGRVLLTGGANSDADCGQDRCLTAGQFAEIYDPHTGTFTAVASAMSSARMFHTATLMPNGAVLIAGGASEARIVDVDAQSPFPVQATQAVSQLEVFDPGTETFTPLGNDPGGARVFHAATLMNDGVNDYVLLSGGIDGLNDAGPNDLSNAHYSTTRCLVGPNPTCTEWNAMVKPRAGHLLFQIGTGHVVAWGGAVETTEVQGVPGWQIEWWDPGPNTFRLVDTPGAPGPERNLFFAAGSQYLEYRMLAAGGLVRNVDGSFKLATENDDGENAVVYVFDELVTENGGVVVGFPGQPRMSLSTPRFLASAAALPLWLDNDGEEHHRVVVAGGFTSLGLAPSSDLAIFDQLSLTVSPLSVGGVPRTLRQARGGLIAVSVGDGTVLLSGGESGIGETRTPVNSSEIFADPQDPQEQP